MSCQYDEGNYVCDVVEQGFEKSREKGTPAFTLKVQPVEVENPETGEMFPVSGSQRQVQMWLTENTVDRVTGRLRDMGWTGTNFKNLDPSSQNHHSFIGSRLTLRCVHEQGQNGVFEKWDFPFDGKPMENNPQVADELDRIFGGKLKASAPKPQQRTNTSHSKAGAGRSQPNF